MTNKKNIHLGIYEKAFSNQRSWEEKILLSKELDFDFIEISIDESDEKLARLDYNNKEIINLKEILLKYNIRMPSMCFSAHRRFPFGSENKETRTHSMIIMEKALSLADKLGIRTIQLAGYDVYYESSTEHTKQQFIEYLLQSVKLASQLNITLAIEIMDHPFINSISKYMEYAQLTNSPYLKVYPDVGNLSAWPQNNILEELDLGINNKEVVAIHLKDTLAVTDTFKGQFKNVPFGEGCVDFVKIFKYLNSVNYQGPFLLEMWSNPDKKDIDEIKYAKEWILKKMEIAQFV